MDSETSLQASFWVMILLQTLGSVDPKNGPRKLPSPKNYVAVVIVWAGLQLLADTGQERGASVAGWVMTLAGLVVGPFGTKLGTFFNTVANTYGVQPSAPGGTSSGVATPSTGTKIA